MAPYAGPSIVQLAAMFRAGKLDAPALGFGIPRAPLVAHKDGTFELRRLSGGEGFGVQADLVSPFVDEGIIVTTKTWQDMIAWLCEHWEGDWGQSFKDGERLVVKFTGDAKAIAAALHREMDVGLMDAMNHARDGFTVGRIDEAAAVCRAARSASATLDFEAVIRKSKW
jgi:hypothetical protein